MKPTILIIDDNQDVTQALSVLFTINNLESVCAHTPKEGLAILEKRSIDLVVQDMNFSADTTSGEEGIELFNQIRQQYVDIPIVLMTAWTHLETAVELVKSGAADYIAKPWDDEKLLVTVNNLLELNSMQSENRARSSQKRTAMQNLEDNFDLCGIRYKSDAMLSLLQMSTQVAASDVPILITGPNGAGKEKIAEVIQANSLVKNGPFVKVNIGALSADLLEAELFGAEAGAYTGATKRRIGRFEKANGGTLFLDEIGNLSMQGQTKLLRVLETGEFERIGGGETLSVDVRIISATNADIPQAIVEGTFREDLFYRLNVINLNLAPLSERKDDIIPLVDMLLEDSEQLSIESINTLKSHHWPGNIRELINTIKRAKLLCTDGMIEPNHLGIELRQQNVNRNKEDVSPEQIIAAVKSARGVISDAAKDLGLSRSGLYRRMKKHSIEFNSDGSLLE